MRTPFLLSLLVSHALLSAGDLTGRLTESGTGLPLPGAVVRSLDGGAGTTTDVLGRFRLEGLPAGPARLEFRYLGYAADTLDVRVPREGALDIDHALSPAPVQLAAVRVRPESPDETAPMARLDRSFRPIRGGQDLFRFVPGMVLAQHAGGGKAEQLFLRGFDLDHGTDIAVAVEGIPVNMVSHAHGQGYADLHFVIPETVREIDYGLGPGDPRHGDFATAGHVDMRLQPVLERSLVQVEGGSFRHARALALVDLLGSGPAGRGHRLYAGGEFRHADGPFDLPQVLQRYNGIARYRLSGRHGGVVDLLTTGYTSTWTQSGLLPERAVESGLVSRFGTLDSAEGGSTSRYNALARWTRPLGERSILELSGWYTHYLFDLTSNFTFFLEDCVYGDRIRQHEDRHAFGGQARFRLEHFVLGRPASFDAGAGWRIDFVDDLDLVRLRPSGEVNEAVFEGAVRQADGFAWFAERIRPARTLTLDLGLRTDFLRFAYFDALRDDSVSRGERLHLSPHLAAEWNPTDRFGLFLQAGKHFHTNDARTLVSHPGADLGPPAWGIDVGGRIKPAPRVLLTLTAWGLRSAQELVYAGDGGVVEPGDATMRLGLDLSLRAQPVEGLYADFDLNFVRARTVGGPAGENLVPLAPWLTGGAGLRYEHDSGFGAELRGRFVADRPAGETGEFTAEGYALLDASVRYDCDRWSVFVQGENLTNASWREAQFLVESRLQGEPEPVEEVHFTPGTPLGVGAGVGVRW